MQLQGLLLVLVLFAALFELHIVSAGFGCPFNQYECSNHCIYIRRAGGYCGGFLKLTCTCVF